MIKRVFWFTVYVSLLSTPAWSIPLQPGEVLLNTHTFLYTDPVSGGQVKLTESHLRSGAVDRFDYEVSNGSYDPNPGSSNGLSGFTITFPAPVPELGGVYNPAGWVVSCCAGAAGTPPDGVEWDISDGPGIMPDQVAEFGFLTGNRADIAGSGQFRAAGCIPGSRASRHSSLPTARLAGQGLWFLSRAPCSF